MNSSTKKPAAYRDMTVPYSEAEIEEVRITFKTRPSYKPEDGGTISVDEVPQILEAMRMERNPEQVQAYKDYWITHFNGRLYLDGVVNILKNVHKNDTYLRSLAQNCDKDGDGLITEEEFADLLNLMTIHDPKLAQFKTTFEKFVAEADLNKDGKVSVEECRNWLEKKTSSL